MKAIFLVLFFLTFGNCFCHINDEIPLDDSLYELSEPYNNAVAWLSEPYINAIRESDSTANNFLFPVEGFIFQNKTVWIQTYGSEPRPVFFDTITENGKIKYKLLYIEYNMNMKYVSRENINLLKSSKIFLSKDGDKLLLEIIRDNYYQNTYFISKIDGYTFLDIYEAKEYIKNKKH